MRYQIHNLDLKNNDQKKTDYLKISPGGKVPAIIDQEGEYGRQIPVFGAGAILGYLAEKSHHFLGINEFEKSQVMSWLMFQASGLGPNFNNYEYARDNNNPLMLIHFELEVKRLLAIMNVQFSKYQYFAGNFYSIADIAAYPWIAGTQKAKAEWYEAVSHVRRWADLMGQRPAVRKVLIS